MKDIKDLKFGFNDAINYKKPENRGLFNKFFCRTEEFQKLYDPSIYFLIGEKGTGKTAYATYAVNNFTFNTYCEIKNVRDTDYQKFIQLKSENHLKLSDYENVWKVLIYLLIAKWIKENEIKNGSFFQSTAEFDALQNAIDEYYLNAFSPEILNALNFVEKTKFSAKVINKHFQLLGEKVNEAGFTHAKFQTNLLYIQNHFEQALSGIRLKHNYTLFIDGIDVRPDNVPYNDYMDCIKGLVNAIWSVNNNYFPSMFDERHGRIRTVLLIRPDIFANIGLQNPNNKIKDNAILLDWRTTYSEYNGSKLFKIADNLLNCQQENHCKLGECWNSYFPFSPHVAGKSEDSFINFLRYSFYRPRDIITMLDYLKNIHQHGNSHSTNQFTLANFRSSAFQTQYSEYLMGEIKDYLSFYYSDADYELFRKFFEYLKNYNFSYSEYIEAFTEITTYINRNNIIMPKFFESEDTYLQFLFELNIIAYIENHEETPYIRWCFRERNYANLSPKVKSKLSYVVHQGLRRNLNLKKGDIISDL